MNTKMSFSVMLFAFAVIMNISCKKINDLQDTEETVDLSKKQSIADQFTDDAFNQMNDALESVGLVDGKKNTNITGRITTCAAVSVSGGSFPKTVTLDFGINGCTSGQNNVLRKGIITIVVSDTFRKPGSTAVMTFNNYYVNGYKKEGTITWLNTSAPGTRSWTRTYVNGVITAPDGRVWNHNSVRNISMVAGLSTPRDWSDDAYTITGTAQTVNPNGVSRQSTIQTPLHKEVSCDYIDQGSIFYQGNNHTLLLDFGNGTCDDQATVSVNNGTVRTITLR
jgi:hypothetical protein